MAKKNEAAKHVALILHEALHEKRDEIISRHDDLCRKIMEMEDAAEKLGYPSFRENSWKTEAIVSKIVHDA